MSEPSLRDTVAEAIEQAEARYGWDAWLDEADAALSVIYTYVTGMRHPAPGEGDWHGEWNAALDAVLALLGGGDDP
jgi:hypothetical protein